MVRDFENNETILMKTAKSSELIVYFEIIDVVRIWTSFPE